MEPELGKDGSRRMGLNGKGFHVSRRWSQNLERMGRAGWVFMGKHFVCHDDGAELGTAMGRTGWVLMERYFVCHGDGGVVRN